MIIGISGKIGSGKDTIGQIIQYLTAQKEHKGAIDLSFRDFKDYAFYNGDWEIKKFAYKLKQITALLLGVTVERLEDREFKEKELGEEWTVYYNSNAFGKLFSSREELLDYYKNNFIWLHDTSKGIVVESEVLTPRKILQLLGTEAGREIIHPNIWVNALFSEYNLDDGKVIEPISEENKAKYPIGFAPIKQQYFREPRYPNWIITDMRFPNELEAVKKRGGITIRVNRISDEAGQYEVKQHPSETALDNHKFDYVIDNSGSMSSLINKVKEICHEIKIL